MVLPPRTIWLLIVLVGGPLPGCRTTASVARWQPPRLVDPAGQTIVLGRIRGPEKVAGPLRRALLETVADADHQPVWIAAESMRSQPLMQLASHRRPAGRGPGAASEELPSEMLLASAARRHGAGYLLVGEVIQASGGGHRPDAGLTVSWRLTGLDEGGYAGGWPVHVDDELVKNQYPHLLLSGDRDDQLRRAAAFQTRALLAASIRRDRAALARPRGTPGSHAVRRGNRLAAAGNWPAAEKIWLDVTRDHPSCAAAWINASVAAVASQSFDEAERLADEGLRRASGVRSTLAPGMTELARENVVWIELVRRDYHRAFDLPPPPTGWRVTMDNAEP